MGIRHYKTTDLQYRCSETGASIFLQSINGHVRFHYIQEKKTEYNALLDIVAEEKENRARPVIHSGGGEALARREGRQLVFPYCGGSPR